MSGSSFIAELKRRHVYKVGAMYGIAGWLLVQVATQVFPFFDVANSAVRLVVILVAIGFPIALILAWIYDLTPEGLVRTDDLPPGGDSPPQARARRSVERRLNYLLGILLLLALGYLVLDRFMLSRAVAEHPAPEASVVAPSIAVLPFADMSQAGDQGYFSDGMSEELLNLLAQVPQLRVTGRTSPFSFKGRKVTIDEIGKALKVSTVLEGSVRKDGDRLRVTAQLVSVADGYQLWSQSYDRKLTDIFAVQDDIAGAVVDALKLKLLPALRPSTARHHVPGFETYDHFLLGRQLLTRDNIGAHQSAVTAFQQAVTMDPQYAEAWSGLAMAESFAAEGVTNRELATQARQRAMAAAEKAVTLDPALGDAFAARGYLRGSDDWNWSGAEADLLKAISLNPEDARNQLRYGYLLGILGRLPEAVMALDKATKDDPLFVPAWYWLARIKAAQADYQGARLALNRALAIYPESGSAASYLAVLSLLQGDAASAKAAFTKLQRPLGLALAEHDLGHDAAARKWLDQAIAADAQDDAYHIAATYAWFGDRNQAFAWLEKAAQQHDVSLPLLKYDPLLRGIRDDPRYAALLRTLRLPP